MVVLLMYVNVVYIENTAKMLPSNTHNEHLEEFTEVTMHGYKL